MKTKQSYGHFAAILTIFIWGTTYISTKVLLKSFQPVEILFLRFMIGYFILWVICPHRLKVKRKKEELIFAAAGFSGICLYFLLENIALTYTLASNVGVIIATAPFFTAMICKIFWKREDKLQAGFLIGFALAMAGILLLSFGGTTMQINPFGDFLALLAAAVWACYAALTKKIGEYGYATVQVTRRIFFYGLICMFPTLFLFDVKLEYSKLLNPVNAGNILFLGAGASALCFATWNFAVKVLGAVKTSVYIYMTPVITVLTSMIILQEKITKYGWIGIILTMSGLMVSEYKKDKLKEVAEIS